MKGSGFPGLKPINKQQGFSLHQLSKLNQQLDNDRLKTFHDQQDIKKQKKIAKQSSAFLNTSIQQIQDQAKQLSRQLEEEKTKHQQLQILVKKAQQQIYSQKLDKYEDVRNNKQTDQFQEQKNILKEKQKKLQKILDKLNSSDFQISKKIDTIRSLKKERGIHSNVFDKLEREYFDVEFYYKQLLIERTLKEKNLEYLVAQFNKIYQKSNENSLKIQSQNSQQRSNLFQSQLTKSQQKSNSKVPQLNFSRQKEANLIQALKTKKQINQSKRNAQETKKIEYQKKLCHILNDFSCRSYQQFMKKDVHKICQKQQQILSQVNQRYEEICRMREQIESLEIELRERKSLRENKKGKTKTNLPNKIIKIESEISHHKQQIQQFKDQFYSILKKLLSQQQENTSPQQDDKILQKIQVNQQNHFNFTQNIETLKQIMGFFNDKILQNHFPNTMIKKRTFKKHSTEKSAQSFKNRKSSIIKVEGKIKKTETQTSENENRNSQCLNEIFNKYQNEIQKPGKTQKLDTISLLTQKQFIVESKRLISEASKKKSQFAKDTQSIKK